MRNIIAMAGGAQYTLNPADNGKDGAVLLILNPQTGELIKGFDSNDLAGSLKIGGNYTGTAPYMGMLVSEPTFQRSYASSVYSRNMAGHIYTADNRGNIFHVGLEQKGSDDEIVPISPGAWKIETLATLQLQASASSSTANYAIPFGVLPYKYGSDTWLAGGTSNLFARKEGVDDSGRIENEKQMIFSFQTVPGEQTSVRTRDNLQALSSTEDESSPVYAPDSHKGWMIPLELEKISGGRVEYYAEYVSAKPILSGGILFIPTFIARGFTNAELNDPDLFCAGNTRTRGDARLYTLNVIDGMRYARFRYSNTNRKYIEIKNAKITGLSTSFGGSKSRGVVTIDKLGAVTTDDDLDRLVENENDAMYVFDLPSGGGVNMEPGQNFIKYWLIQ
jgi:hypothetical protein